MSYAIVGIDPGKLGAVAILRPETASLVIYDMPTATVTGTTKDHTTVNADTLTDLLEDADIVHAYMEKVASSPQMGVASCFSFGDSFGTVKGVLAALRIPRSFVLPQTWKKTLRVPADKKQAVARAGELFPSCRKAFSRPDMAEAAMIALYGSLALGHTITKRIELERSA